MARGVGVGVGVCVAVAVVVAAVVVVVCTPRSRHVLTTFLRLQVSGLPGWMFSVVSYAGDSEVEKWTNGHIEK